MALHSRSSQAAPADIMTPVQIVVAILGVVVCIASMAHIVVSDLTTRLISTRACEVLGVAGAMYQISLFGLGGLETGLLSMAAVTVANVTINNFFHFRVRDQSIGGGDVRCMAALALATGRGCVAGALVCCIAAVAWAVVMQLLDHRGKDEPFAFAPFMALWLVVGLVAGLPAH